MTLTFLTPTRTRSEWLWGGLGVGLASASTVFAAYMITTAPSEVTGYGSKDFGVFARFDKRVQTAEVATPPTRPTAPFAASALANAAIDFEPTGSIKPPVDAARSLVPGQPRPAADALPGFVLRDVARGKALVEHGNRVSLVQPGSMLDGAGEVLAIERRNGAWIVRTASGLIVGR